MQIEQLIELVYWMLVVFGVLIVLVFIASVIIIYKVSKPIKLDFDETIKSPYKYPNPMHTISKYPKDTELK